MLIPASSEFVALCRSQVGILTQGLGATLSAVYLTEELPDRNETDLVPIVTYPESSITWQLDRTSFLLPGEDVTSQKIAHLPSHLSRSEMIHQEPPKSLAQTPGLLSSNSEPLIQAFRSESEQVDPTSEIVLTEEPIVIPLVHNELVMGLLVTGREDRPWNELERDQIDRIAKTLAIARVLDQRAQWLQQQRHQQRLLQDRQHDFLDTLLHQFRNPLTALRTFGKLLLKRLLPGDANREIASSIVRESDRLQELLQQFDQVIDLDEPEVIPLALSPGAMEVNPLPAASRDLKTQNFQSIRLLPSSSFLSPLVLEPCPINAILEPLLVSSAAIAQERHLDLQTEIDQNLPQVQAHPSALREVLSNLLDNALKYTPAGGLIYIQAFEKHRNSRWSEVGATGNLQQQFTWIGIEISDTGPGIPPQDLPHVFERHYRGVQATTDIAGTGLGLAIAAELVQQMGGDLQVFSPSRLSSLPAALLPTLTSVGAGTTFVVWLVAQPE